MSKGKKRKSRFIPGIHGPQVEAIAQAAAEQPFKLEEIGNTYCGPRDRFVVSLVVGYQDGENYLPKTAKQAAAAALDLTTDDGSSGTNWYVFDRKTGKMHCFEQDELENVMPIDNDEDDEDAGDDLCDWCMSSGVNVSRTYQGKTVGVECGCDATVGADALTDYAVHHIDGNPLNNDKENLRIVPVKDRSAI